MTYEGYMDRWADMGLINTDDQYISTPMLTIPRKNSLCVGSPVTLNPWRIALPKMQMLPFIDICLIGV